MNIPHRFLKELGYRKIERYFSEDLDNIKPRIKEILSNTEKPSVYSIAGDWGRTFGIVKLEHTRNFETWFKLYYPLVGLKENELDKIRVLKFAKTLRLDYLEASQRDISEYLISIPKIELDSLLRSSQLSKTEIKLCEFVNSIYGWAVYCHNSQGRKEDFEKMIILLTENDKKFIEKLKE